jgi:hypothetical protein
MGRLADTLNRRLRAAGEQTVEDVARQVLAEAERDLPVGDPADDPDPSVALKRRGQIVHVDGGVIVEFRTPYAAKQHEDLRLKHPRGGNPKFLEAAVTRAIGGVESSAVKHVNDAMRRSAP